MQASGTNRGAAEQALKLKLSDRSLFQPGFTAITPDSTFGALVTYWLEDLDLEDRISRTTRLLYERNMRNLVMPFPSTPLEETVAAFDALVTAGTVRYVGLSNYSAARIREWIDIAQRTGTALPVALQDDGDEQGGGHSSGSAAVNEDLLFRVPPGPVSLSGSDLPSNP